MNRPGASSARAANLLLAAASLAFSLALILLLEGALRLLRIGPAEPSRLPFQQLVLPVLEPAQRADGTPIWRPRDRRLPYQSLPREADDSQLRVFALGASAVAGLGFGPNVAFPRALERTLTRALPGRTPHVVNLGIVGLSSRQVAQLAADVCERYEPDLLVVYSGHNEFLELHAEKYAEAEATPASRALDLVLRSRLYAVTQGLLGREPGDPSLADRELSREDFELAQDRILQRVELSPGEIAEVVDRYEANLDEIARTARAHDVPLALMTVASNWRWLGREDLPEGWVEALLGDAGPPSGERLARAEALLSQRLAEAAPPERWQWRFRLAVVAERRGDLEAARRRYREALDEDPHLRRALSVMNARVASVAERRDAVLVDTVARLAAREEDGVPGFGTFFDHVHFTPRGAELAAAALFEGLLDAGALPAPAGGGAGAYLEERLAALAHLERDSLSVGEWMGLGFDPGQVADRDLWKYDRMVKGLDAHVDDPADRFRALVYRGNAAFFRLGGARDAERDYRAALAVEPHPAVRANLLRLAAEGRLARP